jgi:DNA-binding NarL/FixJ family response regulator
MGATLKPVHSRSRAFSPGTRVVIVADDASLVRTVRVAFLASGDFDLASCANARRTSVQTIFDAQPDVILLDDMEQSDRALELVRAIRAADQTVPVIMLSGRLDSDWLDRAFSAGTNALISTAASPKALETLVRETLSGHIVHRPPPPEPSPATPTRAAPTEERGPTQREFAVFELLEPGLASDDVGRWRGMTERPASRGLLDFPVASPALVSVAAA